MTALEFVAAAFGIVNIVLIARRTVWNYAFGIVSVCLFAVLFWQTRLYSGALLQVFFLASQIYGWWYWAQSRTGGAPVPVRVLGMRGRLWSLAAGAVGTLGIGWAMSRYTDAAAPWADAANAAWSMVAQILTDRRQIESWPLWVAIDILSVWLYASQGLLAASALYAIFLCIACWGWAEWRRAAPRTLAA